MNCQQHCSKNLKSCAVMTWLARLVELSVGIILIWEYVPLTLEMYVNPVALKRTNVVAVHNAENMYSC